MLVTLIHGDSELLQFLAAIGLPAQPVQLHFFDINTALAVYTRESVAALLGVLAEGGRYFLWADATREVGNGHVYLSWTDHGHVQFIHLIIKESFFQKV
jgi:hypothetical protein